MDDKQKPANSQTPSNLPVQDPQDIPPPPEPNTPPTFEPGPTAPNAEPPKQEPPPVATPVSDTPITAPESVSTPPFIADTEQIANSGGGKRKKLIGAIAAVVLLLVSIPAGIFVVQRSAEFREKASVNYCPTWTQIAPGDTCQCPPGFSMIQGQCEGLAPPAPAPISGTCPVFTQIPAGSTCTCPTGYSMIQGQCEGLAPPRTEPTLCPVWTQIAPDDTCQCPPGYSMIQARCEGDAPPPPPPPAPPPPPPPPSEPCIQTDITCTDIGTGLSRFWPRVTCCEGPVQCDTTGTPYCESPAPPPAAPSVGDARCNEIQISRAGTKIQPTDVKFGDTIEVKAFCYSEDAEDLDKMRLAVVTPSGTQTDNDKTSLNRETAKDAGAKRYFSALHTFTLSQAGTYTVKVWGHSPKKGWKGKQ